MAIRTKYVFIILGLVVLYKEESCYGFVCVFAVLFCWAYIALQVQLSLHNYFFNNRKQFGSAPKNNK